MYEPEENQFSDVSFWYQRNWMYWVNYVSPSERKFGDIYWLAINYYA